MRVIRCGQSKAKPYGTRRWTTSEILMACWELDEQRGIRDNPMNGGPELKIAPLVPIKKDK